MKNRLGLVVLMMLSLAFSACKEENEWSNFYGFTAADVEGAYLATMDELVYDDFPTHGLNYTICEDATADITASGGNNISFKLKIPAVINKTFTGSLEQNAYYIQLYRNNYSQANPVVHFGTYLSVTVLKDEKGGVRLHGFASDRQYNGNWETLEVINTVYFDVTKTEN